MRANLRWKRRTPGRGRRHRRRQRGDRARSRARAPELAGRRVEVDPQSGRRRDARCRGAGRRPPRSPTSAGPYAIYVGKLAPNKGVQHLVPAAARGEAHVAARRRRRRSRSRRARARGRAPPASTSASPAGSIAPRRWRYARARDAARLPVARPRVAEPRAARSQRRSASRSRRWTPAARATSSCRTRRACCRRSPDGLAADVARLVADPRAARSASAPRRGPTSAPRSRRPPSSRASARSTTRSSRAEASAVADAPAARRRPRPLRPSAARRRRPRAPRLRSGAPPGAARR